MLGFFVALIASFDKSCLICGKTIKMVAEKVLETLDAPTQSQQSRTRLKIVRTDKHDHVPIPPIVPSTPIISKSGRVWWQLEFDFTRPVQPISRRKPRDRKPRVVKPTIETPKQLAVKKPNRLQKLKALATTETDAQKEIRLLKGTKDRTAFLKWIETGIDHMTGEPVYKRFQKIARSETLRALNKTRTVRGLEDWRAEEIWMDHYHSTILKVAEALGDGVHEFKSEQPNFDDYFYGFLVPDAKRNVRYIDQDNLTHHRIYSDADDDSPSDIWGMLGKILSESPDYLEGRIDEFKEYCYYEMFRIVDTDYASDNTDAQWLDVQCFTVYYSTNQTLHKVADELGISCGRVSKGRDRVLEFVKQNISLNGLQQAFGRKIMEGCNCG
jgi:hypothetical protein